MKKLFVLLAALALAGCNLAGGPGAVKLPTRVAITGAKGLFLATGGGKGIQSMARDAVGSGAQLMKVNVDATVGPATFTAADGSTVSVNITATLQVSAEYLLITYDAGSGAQTAAVSMATGAMMPLAQAPNYFAQVRMLGSVAYFTSGGTLYKADLSSGAETAIGSGLAGNEYLHVTPSGDVYAYGVPEPPGQTFPWAMIFYSAGGSHGFANPGVPSVDGFGLFGNATIVEDQNTGDMWQINWSYPNITAAKFVFDSNVGTPGTPAILSATLKMNGSIAGRIGEQVYYQGSVFIGNSESATIASDGAGGLTVTQWDTSAVPQNDFYLPGGSGSNGLIAGYLRWQTDGVSIYSAPCLDSNTVNLVELPSGGGTAKDPVLVSDTATITSFAVTGGQVLYTDATGMYQQATTVGAKASLYSATPVTLAPVGQ